MKRGLFAILIFLCIQFLASASSLLFMMLKTGKLEYDMHSMAIPMGFSLLIGNIVIIIMFMLYQSYRIYPFNNIYFIAKNKCKTKPSVLAVSSLLILSIAESILLSSFDINDAQIDELFKTMLSSPWCIINLCVVGPIAEEIIFRWGILGGLYRQINKRWLSILISSICFAAIHGNLMQGIPALISGIALGVIYIRSASLFPCVLAHIINNALALFLMLFPSIEEQFTQIGISFQIIVGVLLCVFSSFILSKIHNQPFITSNTADKAVL